MKVRDELAFGRACCLRRAWADAYAALSRADQQTPLHAEDLELLAMSAYLINRDDEYLKALERAHQAHQAAGERSRAVRCAFWIGLRFVFRGEMGPASGWFGRAQRLLEGAPADCVEHGYLLLPVAEQQLAAGDSESAQEASAGAAGLGERFGDADLVACARHLQGRVLIKQGRIDEGLALLDETMVAVTSGELSLIVTGLMYCSVIDCCQRAFQFGRAREWTAALSRWCDGQPQMVAFTGQCLVHRAEIMQLGGAWSEALEEAQRACERSERSERMEERSAAAAACYRLGELHRLQGRNAEAEDAYRRASGLGQEPQPGLALLRLAQRRTADAAAAIGTALITNVDPLARARLLAAQVEIALAAGDARQARSASGELEEIAQRFPADVPAAIASQARGAVELVEGNARTALGALRRAFETWRQIEAPYEQGRARELVALACRALGDEDGAALELAAARAAFEQLGAAPDVARIDAARQTGRAEQRCALTARELQVLRLVAAGKTNRTIAAELFVSEKTVDRHVSNIFSKLAVSSRAAATAYAYEHDLL